MLSSAIGGAYLTNGGHFVVAGSTPHLVASFPVSTCSADTCDDCNALGDPYCGFCPASMTCVPATTCSEDLTLTCPVVETFSPATGFSVDTASPLAVALTGSGFVASGYSLFCTLGIQEAVADGTSSRGLGVGVHDA